MRWKRLWRRQDPKVEEMLADASFRARNHFLTQQMRAVVYAGNTPRGGDLLDNVEKMLTIETAFMWGWHHAYAKAAGEWPTTPSMRASLQMIRYLMDHHGFNFERARMDISGFDQLWNAADPLFDAVSKRGEESYSDPDKPILGEVIVALTAK